jgi:multidrug efflux system membrane fusion protein
MPANAKARRNSILLAAAIAVGFTLWILSGLIDGSPDSEGDRPAAAAQTMHVTVRHSTARTTTRTITASARTEPDRAIELKAETEGRVVDIGAERGAIVAAGQSIVELDMRDRRARLAEAQALIRQRELEFEASERLLREQFISPAEQASREAELVAARAARERVELDIARTSIRAPFDAVVFDRLVEIGDYVAVGDVIAQLVDADPLIVVANINERDIGAVAVGDTGTARVLGGRPIEGEIRYLAPAAEESTRTFRLELAIPNPDFALRVGTSAELELGAEQITAHSLSPGLLTLADNGEIGVKIVDDADRVRFIPVEIAESVANAALVTGLPVEARIITQGQGFVADGQAVIADEEEASALTQAQDERPY